VLDVVRDKQKGGIFPMRKDEDAEAVKIREQINGRLGLDMKPLLVEKDIFQDKQEQIDLF